MVDFAFYALHIPKDISMEIEEIKLSDIIKQIGR